MRSFEGCFTALITPFLEDYSIDYSSLDKIINYQISSGITGLVVLGSTAEAHLLSNSEKVQIIEYVLSKVPGNITVIVAISEFTTDNCLDFAKLLDSYDRIDAYMISPPGYIKPTQDGLIEHFNTIANNSARPIILYNVPGRNSCDLLDATVLKLFELNSNILGIKDATGNIARCNFMVKRVQPGIKLLSGDDATAVSFVLSGGSGSISVVSNVVPKTYSQMCAAAINGNKSKAIHLNNQIEELHSLLFCESNPIPVKYACFYLGLITTPMLRKPLTTLSNCHQNTIRQVIDKINII